MRYLIERDWDVLCMDSLITGVEQNVAHLLPKDDPRQRCPDTSKGKRLLRWEPKVDLEERLRTIIESFMAEAATPGKYIFKVCVSISEGRGLVDNPIRGGV